MWYLLAAGQTRNAASSINPAAGTLTLQFGATLTETGPQGKGAGQERWFMHCIGARASVIRIAGQLDGFLLRTSRSNLKRFVRDREPR